MRQFVRAHGSKRVSLIPCPCSTQAFVFVQVQRVSSHQCTLGLFPRGYFPYEVGHDMISERKLTLIRDVLNGERVVVEGTRVSDASVNRLCGSICIHDVMTRKLRRAVKPRRSGLTVNTRRDLLWRLLWRPDFSPFRRTFGPLYHLACSSAALISPQAIVKV